MADKDLNLEIDASETAPLAVAPADNQPNPQGPDLLLTQSKLMFYSGFCDLPFFIAIAVILTENDDDCNKPIRT